MVTDKFGALPCLIENQGIVTEINGDFCRFTGYNPDELLGQRTDRVLNEFLRLSSLEGIDGRSALFTKSLDVRFVKIQKTSMDNNSNRYLIIEVPLSRFETRNHSLLKLIEDNEIGIGVYIVPGFMLIKANQKYMGYFLGPDNTREQLYGKYLGDIIDEFSGSSTEKMWETAALNNKSFYLKERKGIQPDEARYWDNSLIPVSEGGEVKYLLSMLEDVTERVMDREKIKRQAEIIKEQNRLLRQQKETLTTIIENMHDAISIFDGAGNVTLANAEARNSFPRIDKGLPIENFQYEIEYFDADNNSIPRYELPIHKALKGERIRDERIVIKYSEQTRVIEVNSVPILDAGNNLVSTVVSHHDITKMMEYEKKLLEQKELQIRTEREKNEVLEKTIAMKDEFLSLISHEFKTPLTVINSAIQALEFFCRDELSAKARNFLNKIRQNSNRQLKLVNNLLDITRMNAGRLKVNKANTDIVELTRSIVESIRVFAENKGISLFFSSTISKKTIGIDTEKYERILLNLLSNACKYTGQGKSIKVRLSQRVVWQKYWVCIEVKDKGIGIPEDKVEQIFERFGQVDSSLSRQAEGTGIGLYLVKMLVELLGGTIQVDTKVGKGSTFTVVLPGQKANVTPIEEILNAKEVHDNRLIRETEIEFSDVYT